MTFLDKSYSEVESNIDQIHLHFRLSVSSPSQTLCDGELPFGKSEFFHSLGKEADTVVDVDHLFRGLEPHLGGVGLLVGGVLHHHSQRPNPGDLLPPSILYEEGVHLEEAVADEVEGEVLFSVDGEAEELARWEHDAVVGVSSHI